ncbi:MAG: FecR family protein [Mucilaginibacter sp.]
MENNNQFEKLLVRYLVNEVNFDEKEFVENWLNSNIENQRYFVELKTAWQLLGVKQTLDFVLDEMNVDEKWDHFIHNITNDKQAKVISINEQEQFEDEYLEDVRAPQKSKLYRVLITTAIAASVTLMIGLGWVFIGNNKEETSVGQNTKKMTDSLTFVVKHEVNTTGKEKRIKLSDGSLIILANNSEVTYRQPFTDRRDITLSGKAFFKVAKDKARPFTVVSSDISTTALGTEFTITAFEKSKNIIVRLYEGKVVVRAVKKANKTMKDDVYLLPGQELVYSNQTGTIVGAIKLKDKNTPEKIMQEELARDNPLIPTNDGSWFMFNNQTLDQVLDQLAALYNVEIVYSKKDVQNIYIISKYNKSEPLETILKEISIPNKLTVTKKDAAFIISR